MKVTGYIFESFNHKRAIACANLIRTGEEEILEVEANGLILFMLTQGPDDMIMRHLCCLLQEGTKQLVTVEALRVRNMLQ